MKDTEYLDNFMSDITNAPLSNCCGTKVYGELYKNFGRCSNCMEMAEFTTSQAETN